MKDILNLIFLGFVAGFLATFWTRITRPNMILGFIGKYFYDLEMAYHVRHINKFNPFKGFSCSHCISPWIAVVLFIWYAIGHAPFFMDGVIGFFACIASGNFICEIVHGIRGE